MPDTAPPPAAPLRPSPVTEELVCAQPAEDHEIALVLKRTYRIGADGRCLLADAQIPIEAGSPNYDPDAPAPSVSPPCWDSDLLAFKPATDVIVQGHAYGYGQKTMVDAELRVGRISRVVRVIGERRCEGSDGNLRFGPPQPFEKMPLRYNRAYGGCDTIAFARHQNPVLKSLAVREPKWHLDRNTRFHYPRNPAGVGYLIERDAESVAQVRLPNLEFPFDPVTPERLAVRDARAWLAAPLPAGFDWYDPGWFPRLAFLGLRPDYTLPGQPITEVARGWVPPDLLARPPRIAEAWDTRFFQAASPGLSIASLDFEAELTLRNLFPDATEARVCLPGKQPRVVIEITPRQKLETQTRLNAVVLQPDLRRLILIWSARAKVHRPYARPQLDNMRWSVA